MKSCQDFPVEIVQNILGYIHSTTDLIQCQIANKHWSYLTQKLIYTSVTLNSIRATYNYIHSIKESKKKLGLFAHTIYFNYPIDALKDRHVQEILDDFSSFCPNLKSIQVIYPLKTDRWFYLLSYLDNNLQLEKISPSYQWKSSFHYTNIVCQFAHSLTHLTISQHNELLLNGNDYYNRIMNTKLPQLNTLEIIMDEGRTISFYDEFIQICPVLHTIRCLDRTHFKNTTLPDTNSMPYHEETKLDLSLIQPRQDIKVCEGTLVMNCGESILYFIHKFPQLEKLDICIDCDFEYEKACEFNFTHNAMLSLLIYISKIHDFRVKSIRMPNTIDALISFMETTHFDGVIRIEYQETNDKNLKLWTGTNPKLDFENYFVKRGILEQKMTVIFPIDPNEEDYSTSIEKEVYLPHIEMIDRMHGLVKQLDLGESYGERSSRGIGLLNSMTEWMGGEPDYDAYAFNGIFNTCSSLKTLYLDLLQLMECEPSSEMEGICETLETLNIKRSNLSIIILPQLSNRLPALKYLYMTKCTMITENHNTFKIYLPKRDMNTISCIDPILYDLTSTEFYLQLKTKDKGTQWFKSNKLQLNTCLKEDYNNSLKDSGIVSFDIVCQSIRFFHFKIGKISKRIFTL